MTVFHDAVVSIFSSWNALEFAVSQKTGGAESLAISNWMVDVTEQYFNENKDLEPDELADYLSVIMDQELNTLVDDNSDLEISTLLCQVYNFYKSGDMPAIHNIISSLPAVSANLQANQIQSTSDDDDDEDVEVEEITINEEPLDYDSHQNLTSVEKDTSAEDTASLVNIYDKCSVRYEVEKPMTQLGKKTKDLYIRLEKLIYSNSGDQKFGYPEISVQRPKKDTSVVSKKYKPCSQAAPKSCEYDEINRVALFCLKCDITYKNKKGLSQHIHAVHKQMKPYKCAKCYYECYYKSSLVIHISSVHKKIKAFKCFICSRAFSQKGNLSTHSLTIHKKVKPFICLVCNQTFGQKGNLSTHILTVHKKVRPYTCLLCTKAFGQKGNLSSHIRKIH